MFKFNHDFGSRFRILKGGKISLVVSAMVAGTTISFASPSDGVVTSGTASISQSGNTTNITQTTDKASINWNKFNIAANETVNFNQPNSSSITLNRVIGNEKSVIDGALNANGQVWILNSNGILFNKNAKINTAGILATTAELSDTNFQNGNYDFKGNSNESVINLGTIEVSNNGSVVLAANEVVNSGTIKAVRGKVHLVGANEYTVNLNRNSLVNLRVNKGVLDAMVENSGTISANGGEIYLSTNAVNELLKGVVNNTGIIEANSLDGLMGKVNISSNIIVNNGEINANGEIGGTVTQTANMIIDAGTTDVSAINNAGTITQNSQQIKQSNSAVLKADSKTANAGTINIKSDVSDTNSNVYISGTMSATGVNGGKLNVTANSVSVVGANITTSGTTNAGEVKIGGDWQGVKTTLDNATTTSVLNSNITNEGKDGTIVVWSDSETSFNSKILAKDSNVEISSKDKLNFSGVNVQAKNLLLDPKNIEIKDASGFNFIQINNPNITSGDNFQITTELSNGNLVATATGTDVGAILDVGAVYLFKGDGTLISTLTGSNAYDQVGSGGITALSNGNYVVSSISWYNLSGAVTWVDGTSVISEVVSTSNSLIGSNANDMLESRVTALSNGNYVVSSRKWDNGTIVDAGAVTWGNGASGTTGEVSATNSLVGTRTDDMVGIGGVTALSNGNYVVGSYNWDNEAVANVGAVTWGSGTTGVKGTIDASNSLVGIKASDQVGIGGVTALSDNGNYVVNSYKWANENATKAGAVTWGNGVSGVKGAVSASNSLVGIKASDYVGYNGITALSNGNYVVSSSGWDNGIVFNTGAVTWGNGTTGVKGRIDDTNSLVGAKTGDNVGGGGVTALSNGNYVVKSNYWDNGDAIDAGAVSWGSGTSGISGAVSSSNSLVGSNANDMLESRVTALSNGNYVVSSYNWDNGTTVDAGAATWGNGTSGVTGTISATNSLVGTRTDDMVGIGGVTALSDNGNYVVSSYNWDNGTTVDAGAATWGSGTTGIIGAVDASNSLVGTTANDQVGSITALSNGNYVVRSSNWDNGSVIDAGAVTWGNGTSGVKGPASASNSLVGTKANDQVGNGGITALSNGNYVVKSNYWDNGDAIDVGAVSWGSGASGISGEISSNNSFIGQYSVVALKDNKVALNNTSASNGGTTYITDFSKASDKVTSALFSTNASADSIITPDTIKVLLDAGTAVTLQANNDITLSKALSINNASGNGGALTFQAGRNINLNANITTDNGNFTALAGDKNADSSNIDTGTPTITIANGVTIDAGTGKIVLYAKEGNFVNNSGSATPFTASLTSIYLPSYENATLNSLTVSNKRYNTTYTGGCLTTDCVLPTSGVNMLYSVAPVLTITPNSNQTATYGDAFSSTYLISGYVDSDTLVGSGITGTAAFNISGDKSSSNYYIAGTHNVVYSSGLLSSLGYSFKDDTTSIDEYNISKANLTVSGLTTSNKVYDANKTAALSGTATVTKLGSDNVTLSGTATGEFADKNVGDSKTVTVSGNTITGTDATNYNLVQQTGLSADISKANLTVSGLTASNKTYDANTTATLAGTASITAITGDNVILGGTATGTFADKNVGTAKAVTVLGNTITGTDADNYNLVQQTGLSADISKANLTVSGLTTSNKVYDANKTAALSGTATVTKLGSDNVTLSGTATGTFADKNVGTAKAVTVLGNTITGTDADNYNLVQQTGLSADISKANLTVSGLTASNKTYDANTTATLDATNAAITALGSDVVTLAGTATGTFADKNVGDSKTVTVSGNTITGTDATNYNLVQQTGLSADISKANLTVSGLTVSDKIYDAKISATLKTAGTIDKFLDDEVTLTTAATFNNKNVETTKTVNLDYTLSGEDASNYSLANASNVATSAKITPKAITVSADDKSKVSGEIDETLTYKAIGLLGSDTLVGTLKRAEGENAGVYLISKGALANSNYNITFLDGKYTITEKPSNNKVQDNISSIIKVPNIVVPVVSPVIRVNTNSNVVSQTTGISTPTKLMTMSEIKASSPASSSSSAGGSQTPQDVRVPLSSNSIIDLVNGGINLPVGVEQQFFVVNTNQFNANNEN